MKFTPPLAKGRLIRRYKRFLAEVELDSGEIITLHCPNTGSMKNCLLPGSDLWYLPATDPKRSTAGSWVITTTPFGALANINTHYANRLVEEALLEGLIDISPFTTLKREVRYGTENSRIDFCLTKTDGEEIYIEVKSVTLGFEESDIAAFPDAVTIRGQKHLRELTALAKSGTRAILLYCVNLTGAKGVRPADEIDPTYGKLLREAVAAGVEVIAYGTTITPEEIKITHPLPVIL